MKKKTSLSNAEVLVFVCAGRRIGVKPCQNTVLLTQLQSFVSRIPLHLMCVHVLAGSQLTFVKCYLKNKVTVKLVIFTTTECVSALETSKPESYHEPAHNYNAVAQVFGAWGVC